MIHTSETVKPAPAVTADGAEPRSPGFADVGPVSRQTSVPLSQADMGHRARPVAAS